MHYHRNAKTNVNQRAIIKKSLESARKLSRKYEVSHVTCNKWKKAEFAEDKRSTPHTIHYAVPKEFWKIIKRVRQKALMPLDDLFLAMQPYIPNLNRTNCYRVLTYLKLNKLSEKEKRKSRKFKMYKPGYLHIDVFYLPKINKKRYYCFLAIDRATRMVFLELYERKGKEESADFLFKCLSFFPFRIYTILTDNGREFTMRGAKPFGKEIKNEHLFELACKIFGIEHRKTKVRHPWTNGMAEKMVDITKDHTTRINHYKNSDEALADIKRFQIVHNFQRRLKALNFKSPYEVTMEWFIKEPNMFIFNPNELLTRL
jgi:transposase-like protein